MPFSRSSFFLPMGFPFIGFRRTWFGRFSFLALALRHTIGRIDFGTRPPRIRRAFCGTFSFRRIAAFATTWKFPSPTTEKNRANDPDTLHEGDPTARSDRGK